MPDIREVEDLDEIEEWIIDNYQAIVEGISQSAQDDSVKQLEIDEIIIGGEYGRGTPRDAEEPLNFSLVLKYDGPEETSQSEVFQEFAQPIAETFNAPPIRENVDGFEPPILEIYSEFDGIYASSMPVDQIEEGLNYLVNLRSDDPNRAYSLTRDQNIIVTEGGIEREAAGARVREEVVPDTPQNDIKEYPNKQEIVDVISEAFYDAAQEIAPDYDAQEDDILRLQVENIIFGGEWANGEAEFGVDQFEITVFPDLPGEESASGILRFNRIARDIQEEMLNQIEPTDRMKEWSAGINIAVLPLDNYESRVESLIDIPDEDVVYDITADTILFLEESETVGFDIEQEQLGTSREPEPEPGQEQEPQPEPEPDPEEEESEPEPDFPEVQVELRQYAVTENKIEVPAGKETKAVEPRDLYPFEKELISMDGGDIEGVPELQEGIGFHIATNRFGNEAAPGSFPRTGTYIKNRLKYEGPAHLLGLYNDLVVYTGYVRTIHNVTVKPGTYQSFREFIYRLSESDERLGVKLIRDVPQQELASRGISVIPKLPNGQEAPWLENKRYIDVVEDNYGHPAWRNITEAIQQAEQG